jgi:hypothetical protein
LAASPVVVKARRKVISSVKRMLATNVCVSTSLCSPVSSLKVLYDLMVQAKSLLHGDWVSLLVPVLVLTWCCAASI